MKTKAMILIVGSLILSVLFCVCWTAAQTQPTQPAPKMMCKDRFNEMDINHDGVVDKTEFTAVRHPGGHGEEVFSSRDKNGDGVLTQEEFCSGRGMGQRGKGQGPPQ